MDYGHWNVICDELSDWKSFTYVITDENGKKYVGAKTRIKNWETYFGSCKPLQASIKSGLKCHYAIVKFFSDSQSAFDYEDELLTVFDAVKSD